MQGRQEIQPKLFYQVNLESLVPQNNYYRKLSDCLDLTFLYKETNHYYGSEGQESIDPVVFFKMLLVGYLNNINSNRKLVEYCANSLDVRLFIKYDLDEPLPWHSTISRTRQLYGEKVFLLLFQKVLTMCVRKGMVKGKRQAVDSAFIKANASMGSLVEKEVVEDASAYVDQLNEGSEYKVTSTRKKLVDRHHNWKQEAYKDMPGHQVSEKVDEFGNMIRPRFLSNQPYALQPHRSRCQNIRQTGKSTSAQLQRTARCRRCTPCHYRGLCQQCGQQGQPEPFRNPGPDHR